MALLVIFSACRKNDVVSPVASTPAAPAPAEVSYDDIVKDSALVHARDLYLWYNQLPANMNARQYADPAAILQAVRSYSNEPGYSQPVDRWSFAVKKEDWNNASTGSEADLGFSVLFNTATDLRVKFVERESAAGRAGIERGWRILAINGNTRIDTTSSSIQMIVDAVFNSSNGNFKFRKPDGNTVDIALSAAPYNEHAVMADKIFNLSDGTRVGYMVFNSFMSDTTDSYNEFARVFSRFAQNNVRELVIDLRYNGGGYVTVAEKLANYLAPATANGQKMMVQTFNDKYSRYNETTYFKKTGGVNVNRIYFIVSSGTASASELVINSVKPFVDVKLIGPSTATHGKPVGFFPLSAGSWYVFPVSFKTVNKNGEGNYYNGFPVYQRVRDGVDFNWGDANESCLKAALDHIQSEGVEGRTAETFIPQIQKNEILGAQTFKGVIDTRGLR